MTSINTQHTDMIDFDDLIVITGRVAPGEPIRALYVTTVDAFADSFITAFHRQHGHATTERWSGLGDCTRRIAGIAPRGALTRSATPAAKLYDAMATFNIRAMQMIRRRGERRACVLEAMALTPEARAIVPLITGYASEPSAFSVPTRHVEYPVIEATTAWARRSTSQL